MWCFYSSALFDAHFLLHPNISICSIRKLHGKHAPGHHIAWHGVHTLSASSQRVVGIVLPKNKLDGKIPEELGWCSEIKTISFPWNELYGAIPEAWSSLTSLKLLDISNNKLTGAIPPQFFAGAAKREARDRGTGLQSINLGKSCHNDSSAVLRSTKC